jgi:dTDP-D-glucose 4,6-dehydratase
MLLVTGGAGFIGSNFVLSTIAETGEAVVNLDKLTYAGSLRNLERLRDERRHIFVQGDICDRHLVRELLRKHRPTAVVHFAAESHVDRSISGPGSFVQRRRHVFTSRGVPRLLREPAGRALSARLDRRGLWLARSDRSALH